MIWKVYAIYFGFASMLLFALFKTISIQVENSTSLLDFGKNKIEVRFVDRDPRPGDILDVNLAPLVTSVTYFDIYMDPTVVSQELFDSDLSDLCQGLSDMFPDKTPSYYQAKIRAARKNDNKYLLIKKAVTNQTRKSLSKLPIFKLGKFKGGFIDNNEINKRKRPNGELLKRTLGFYRKTSNKEYFVGIEGAYYQHLKGDEGKEVEQKISTGWKKTGEIVKESVDGANIITSIDKDIQEVAHSELERQLKSQEAQSGCAVVMDVKTGFVKAIVNLTRNKNGDYKESYNHVIGTKSVPGSTFKLASLMALLEDNKLSVSDIVHAKGSYTFFGNTLHDSKHGGYGMITVQQAFEKSSNVFSEMVYDAYKNDPNQFLSRLDAFGVTKKLGIDLMGEASPKFHRPGTKGWSGISLPWMAIGYGFEQAPIQTLSFYNAVANDGKFVRPQFVEKIVQNGQLKKEFKPIILNKQICSSKTIKELKKCMEGVMKKGGTGEKLTSTQFSIAGKTGTAKLLNASNTYDGQNMGNYQASFVGYFPANNPIYSCIVLVTNPKLEIYGAKVAGTVFNAIANKVYATRLEYHNAINEKNRIKNSIPALNNGYRKDLVYLLNNFNVNKKQISNSDWLYSSKQNSKVVLRENQIKSGLVPNVKGMSAKDAVYLIESLGMTVVIKGYGKVVSQSIRPGSKAFSGGIIEINLEK